MEYSPKKMLQLLEQNGFDFKKNFGQNFIIDENVICSIVDQSMVDDNTLVVEIGPGAGSLTYHLALKAKHVLCYEIDTRLENVLKHNLHDVSNVDIIFQDFLEANVKEDLKKYQYDKLYVVANLPYYITTPIIMKLIEDDIDVSKIVVMVQKEVGDRFKASPGSKDYGSLSVFLNYYFDVKKLMDISKHIFVPKPNVDSIVVEFKRKNELPILKDRELFFRLIRNSFMFKRKTLRNNLKKYDLEVIEKVLSSYGYDLGVRAEQLSLEVFVDMANSLAS